MLQLACRDLGMDCDHVVHGESVSDVKQKAMVHATEVHAEVLKTMSSPEQLAAMDQLIEAKIR